MGGVLHEWQVLHSVRIDSGGSQQHRCEAADATHQPNAVQAHVRCIDSTVSN